MKKDLAKFEDWPFKVPSIKNVIRNLDALTSQLKNASTQIEALKVFKKMSRYSDKINDDFTHIQVLFSLDTTNEKYQKAMNVLNKGLPMVDVSNLSFAKAMLESKFRPYLEEKLGSHLFQIYEYTTKAFDERIVEEAQKENELVMKYDMAKSSLKFEFRGKTYNLPQMEQFLVNNDRETRKEAAEVYYGYLESRSDEFEKIYDDLVKLRDAMARKLGYKNYVELAYIRMSRFDYDENLVSSYRKQILDVVTPLTTRLKKDQFKRLGIKNPKIYDMGVMWTSGNPIPLGNTDEKVAHAQEMYQKLSVDTNYFFNFMVDHHLLFLDAKPGKNSGGYMTYFPVHECPIIFSNFNGTSGDVDVLTHEFGHSFQAYVARNIKIPEYRAPTMESCEIDSMSMEFFAEPYMNLFFAEPGKYRYLHLADSISFLPYGVTVDEFQHWVYEHPNATPDERDAIWHELENKYTPWKVELEKDCPFMLKGRRWLIQSHIFSSPFYYIDYTLAQVCAFEFFNLDRKNHASAWKKYMKLCKLGGKYPFQTLLAKVGLKSPFAEGTLKKTINPLKKVLASYHAENF